MARVRSTAPPKPRTSAAAVCTISNSVTLRLRSQRAYRDADDVGAQQRQLQQDCDRQGILVLRGQRTQSHADDHEVGRERHRPAKQRPAEDIAEPECRYAEGNQVEGERRNDACLQQQGEAGWKRRKHGHPCDRLQALPARDQQEQCGQRNNDDGAASDAEHVESRRRLEDQGEGDEGGGGRVEQGARYLRPPARTVGQEEPYECVRKRQGDAHWHRKHPRLGHRTKEEAAGQHEKQPAGQRKNYDRIVGVSPRPASWRGRSFSLRLRAGKSIGYRRCAIVKVHFQRLNSLLERIGYRPKLLDDRLETSDAIVHGAPQASAAWQST